MGIMKGLTEVPVLEQGSEDGSCDAEKGCEGGFAAAGAAADHTAEDPAAAAEGVVDFREDQAAAGAVGAELVEYPSVGVEIRHYSRIPAGAERTHGARRNLTVEVDEIVNIDDGAVAGQEVLDNQEAVLLVVDILVEAEFSQFGRAEHPVAEVFLAFPVLGVEEVVKALAGSHHVFGAGDYVAFDSGAEKADCAEGHRASGSGLHRGDKLAKAFGRKLVVRVDEHHVFAVGIEVVEGHVAGGTDSSAGLVEDLEVLAGGGEGVNQFARAVGRAVVDEDDFDVFMGLGNNG